MKQIAIEFNEDGTVKIEAIGFTGQACEKFTAELEKELGTVTDRKKKPEYYQHNAQAQAKRIGQ